MKRLEPIIQKHCERELQPLLDAGHGDMGQVFASRFCGWVEAEWLNLEPEVGQMLAERVNPFVQAYRRQDWEYVRKASDEFYEMAKGVFEDRKKVLRDPEDDPASSLITERDSNGEPLDDFNLL
jgi:cytochrome P450